MHPQHKISLALTTLVALGLAAAHPAAAQSSLSGKSKPVNSAVTVDLTNEGLVDWTKYSQDSNGNPVTYRKMTGNGIISITGTSGPQTFSNVGNDAPNFTWTDGAAPNQSKSDSSEYFYGQNGGISTGSFTVQSKTQAGNNVFNLYTGCYNGGATITSDLYDANGVIIQTFSDTFAAAPGQNYYTEYSFVFSGGDHLATTVTSTNLYGNSFHTVNLEAASLSTPEPSSTAAFGFAGLGMACLVFKARKRRSIVA